MNFVVICWFPLPMLDAIDEVIGPFDTREEAEQAIASAIRSNDSRGFLIEEVNSP